MAEVAVTARYRSVLGLLLCVTAVVIATTSAPAAWAWSQTYVRDFNWGPGSSKASGTNSITYDYVSFDHRYGGLPQMGTTLCNSSATSCYAWRWSNTGLITDERNIAYGFAACKANTGNTVIVWVNYCAAGNG